MAVELDIYPRFDDSVVEFVVRGDPELFFEIIGGLAFFNANSYIRNSLPAAPEKFVDKFSASGVI